ncbi:hypothetical protein ACJW31_04G023000 [Castanea mollissima]
MDLIFMESVWWVFSKPLRRALFIRISSDPEDRFTPRPVLARTPEEVLEMNDHGQGAEDLTHLLLTSSHLLLLCYLF